MLNVYFLSTLTPHVQSLNPGGCSWTVSSVSSILSQLPSPWDRPLPLPLAQSPWPLIWLLAFSWHLIYSTTRPKSSTVFLSITFSSTFLSSVCSSDISLLKGLRMCFCSPASRFLQRTCTLPENVLAWLGLQQSYKQGTSLPVCLLTSSNAVHPFIPHAPLVYYSHGCDNICCSCLHENKLCRYQSFPLDFELLLRSHPFFISWHILLNVDKLLTELHDALDL